jgi:hypothetical protein
MKKAGKASFPCLFHAITATLLLTQQGVAAIASTNESKIVHVTQSKLF